MSLVGKTPRRRNRRPCTRPACQAYRWLACSSGLGFLAMLASLHVFGTLRPRVAPWGKFSPSDTICLGPTLGFPNSLQIGCDAQDSGASHLAIGVNFAKRQGILHSVGRGVSAEVRAALICSVHAVGRIGMKAF